MTVAAGQQINASDYIDTSAGAGDAGKVVKLDAAGKVSQSMLKRFGVKAYQNGGTSIGGGHSTIAFQTEAWDDDTMHDNVTNNSRITFNTAGYWLITASMYTSGTSTSGAMGGRITLNGGTVIAAGGGLPYQAGVNITVMRHFDVGDYIEFSCISPPTTVSSDGQEGTNFCAQLLQKD